MGSICKVLFILSVTTSVFAKCPPEWSNTYHVQGTLYLPYAEIAEPFEAWYDANSASSRIDNYHGMVKTYQLSRLYQYGASLKIAPVTTETETNVETCMQVNGTSDGAVSTQSVLPLLTDFEFKGNELKNGVRAEKWEFIETVEDKVNYYTMWVQYTTSNDGSKVTVPVRYEMKGYDSLYGSHYDHYYLNYENFEVTVNSNAFNVKSLHCVPFPQSPSSSSRTLLFNPMAEYVYPASISHVNEEFDKYSQKYGAKYETTIEQRRRRDIFMHNLRFIHSANRENRGYTLAVNHLADRSPEDLKYLRGRRPSKLNDTSSPFPYKTIVASSLPQQFDWRLYGAVTPVKDQAVCGSCWSFGTIGGIEGAYFLKTGGHLTRFSEQALIDCSWGYGNDGCDGGDFIPAYKWMMKHGGIPTYEDYGGYLGADGFCHINDTRMYATITGYVNIPSNNENALKVSLLKHGPIPVAIDASHPSFGFYSHGVYYEPECGNKDYQLDHAVLLVGYGTMNGKKYWLVKNSWSNYWGDSGFILMAIKNNNCGVMTVPTYVTM